MCNIISGEQDHHHKKNVTNRFLRCCHMSNVTWQDEMACDITFNVADDVAKNFRHQFVLSYC